MHHIIFAERNIDFKEHMKGFPNHPIMVRFYTTGSPQKSPPPPLTPRARGKSSMTLQKYSVNLLPRVQS